MIPLIDLKRQHDPLRSKIVKAISDVIDSSQFVLGEELVKFEKEFAQFCGAKYALGVGSGADALRLTTYALGIGKGDEVISVANTFTATIDAVVHAGAKPVLVDCDEYFNINPILIEKKITKRTKGIIVVHLYGQPAKMDVISSIAKKHNLFIVEDCAQAHGAKYKGKNVGNFGIAGCYSFYPSKNLGALGDGGAITTNSKAFYTTLKKLRFYGSGKNKYQHEMVAFNSRLDNLQAAVLRIKLRQLSKWNRQRRSAATLYTRLLKGFVETPKVLEDAFHVYYLYVIVARNRDELFRRLQKNQIYAGIHYPIPLHLQKAHRSLGYHRGDFPVTERYAKSILSLPIFPGIKKSETEKVVKTIKNYYKN